MEQVFVNGKFVAKKEARVSVFDRGFLFADAVYEVTSVVGSKLLEFSEHMSRLKRSLSELDIKVHIDEGQLLKFHKELIARNRLKEGIVYLQISRGSADRNFLFPEDNTEPTLIIFTQQKNILNAQSTLKGQSVITVEDLRWERCDIKTVQLLYPSMMKTFAKNQGADDAWMVKDELITEGTSSNAFIIWKKDTIITRSISNDILPGITRSSVLECAESLKLHIEERPFSIEEAENASEAFSTSAPTLVNPVVSINEKQIAAGKPGLVTSKLLEIYIRNVFAKAV